MMKPDGIQRDLPPVVVVSPLAAIHPTVRPRPHRRRNNRNVTARTTPQTLLLILLLLLLLLLLTIPWASIHPTNCTASTMSISCTVDAMMSTTPPPSGHRFHNESPPPSRPCCYWTNIATNFAIAGPNTGENFPTIPPSPKPTPRWDCFISTCSKNPRRRCDITAGRSSCSASAATRLRLQQLHVVLRMPIVTNTPNKHSQEQHQQDQWSWPSDVRATLP